MLDSIPYFPDSALVVHHVQYGNSSFRQYCASSAFLCWIVPSASYSLRYTPQMFCFNTQRGWGSEEFVICVERSCLKCDGTLICGRFLHLPILNHIMVCQYGEIQICRCSMGFCQASGLLSPQIKEGKTATSLVH